MIGEIALLAIGTVIGIALTWNRVCHDESDDESYCTGHNWEVMRPVRLTELKMKNTSPGSYRTMKNNADDLVRATVHSTENVVVERRAKYHCKNEGCTARKKDWIEVGKVEL